MLRQAVLLVLLACATAMAMAGESFLWVEGEQPTTKAHIVDNSGLNSINPYALSGGAWLSSFTEANMTDVGAAEYALEIPVAGAYHFWLRAVTGTALAYRVDGGDWVYVNGDKGLGAECTAANGNFGWPPMIAWFDQGTLDLTAGKHTLGLMLGGTKEHTGRFAAIDCFVLTTGAFTPHGKYKPDETAPVAAQDIPQGQGWDFAPAPDPLSADAVLDLRYLNEKTAGEHGFIRLSKDGNSFVRGDGQPIRFWATGESADLNFAEMKRHAQFLAKRGVNIIRLHVQLAPREEGSKITDVDEPTLDYLFRTVAAMKTAGIYTVISPFWGDAVTIRKSWGTMAQGGTATGLLYFEPTLQKGYRAWLKALYTRVNPYTKIKMAEDPAVAIIQYQNENSLLWWATSQFNGEVMSYFRQLYAKFLVAKYGSLEKARAAWQDYNPPKGEISFPSEWDKGLPGMGHIWDLTRDGMAKKGPWPGFKQCSGDFTEFLCRTMYGFNKDTAAYLRQELGCKQLISSDNWRGPDGLTQDAEYWTGTAVDVLAKNCYTGGYHTGINDGWQVLAGGYYSNDSIIKNPVALPFNFKQSLGHPSMVPETSWVHPDLYQSEGPLLMAAQSDLTGFDIGFWFCTDYPEWCSSPITKWSDNTPMLLGQFPAAALIFRQGLVKAGTPALVEERPLPEVFQRKTPLIFDEIGWDDPNHSAGVTLSGKTVTAVDQLAYLVGPVQVVFGGNPKNTKIADLTKYIDRTNKVVRSITGEITTEYGKGIYRVNAPKAQAVAGFLRAAGPQALADVAITCQNNYATIMVVPMDNQPIKSSTKVLVQIGTISRPTGWVSVPATLFLGNKPFPCQKLITPGAMPWQVENADVTLTVANPKLTGATLLDCNGMATTTPVKVKQTDGKLSVTVPPNTMYLVLSAGKAPTLQ